ncbi:hypothetical protein [Variovorax gossypii]
MAESARARAQSDNPSTSHEPSFLEFDDFALQTCDDADALNEVMRGYIALEKLVDPGAVNDSGDLALNRAELSALLRLLNEALSRRIDTVNAAAGTLRAALKAPKSTVS